MNKTIYYSTALAAVLLTALCLALPSYQWATLSEARTIQLLAALAALALSICKITFYPIAIEAWHQQRRLLATVFFVSASVALLIGITATENLIKNNALSQQNESAVNSQSHQQALNNVQQLNNAIAALNDSIRRDIEAGYRQRAYNQQENLQSLMSKRDEAAENLKSIANASPNGAQSLFLKNLTIGSGDSAVTLEAATGAAISLHLGCVLAILALTLGWHEKTVESTEKNRGKKNPRGKKTKREEEQLHLFGGSSRTARNITLDEEQKKLAEKIQRGDYGPKPVVRNIIINRDIKGGYRKVAPVFDYLVGQGVLSKTGRTYTLKEQGE